ncbi:MAG: DUF1214 domain-containing protein [Pseudomonadota bacterium]
MVKVAILIVIAILGAAIGAGSALWAAGIVGGRGFVFSDIDSAGWVSDWSIGSEAAGPYTRARIARHGLLAMTKEEAVYFTRNTEDQGERLSESCRYVLSGEDQPAEWWSITLYDAQSRLPMNDDGALSLDVTRTGRTQAWEAMVSATRQAEEGLWISSRNAGAFDLTLRLYRPSQAMLDDPLAELNAPSIRRVDCEDR